MDTSAERKENREFSIKTMIRTNNIIIMFLWVGKKVNLKTSNKLKDCEVLVSNNRKNIFMKYGNTKKQILAIKSNKIPRLKMYL